MEEFFLYPLTFGDGDVQIKLKKKKKEKGFCMYVGANKRSSWLPRWLKLDGYIPNLNQGSKIEKAFTKRTNSFLQER